MQYWAHSPSESNPVPHLLIGHSLQVAQIAAELAASFGGEDLAFVAGLFHDVGKATNNFQNRLRGLDHVSPARHPRLGAVLLRRIGGECAQFAAYLVDHHHGHFYDYDEYTQRMDQSVAACEEDPDPIDGDICQSWLTEVQGFLKQLLTPDVRARLQQALLTQVKKDERDIGLFLRMVHSCLIEADRIDTIAHGANKSVKERNITNWGQLVEGIEGVYKSLPQDGSAINNARGKIAAEAMEKLHYNKGMFSLDAFTGSGKTVTSSRWMASHGQHNNMSRIIYLAPFLSIIEQNANEMRKFFGGENVVEHHTLAAREEGYVDWNRPVIVTTMVQFLESLFSKGCSRLRKIHNVANSVIMIDEFHSIPLGLLAPTFRILEQLCEHYGCSVVLASATSPLAQIEKYNLVSKPVTRLVNCAQYEEAFKRSEISIDFRRTAWRDIVEKAEQHEQAMIVTNMKKGCLRIKDLLPGMRHVFHLSTSMTPSHRTKALNEVRERLDNNEKVLLVCTPTVEAGVDIDFPVVFRQRAPYDSIEQARGRCNRHGKRAKPGLFHVFSIEERAEELLGYEKDQWFVKYDQTYHAVKEAPDSVERVSRYYESVFNQGDQSIFDGYGIIKSESLLKIETSSDNYKLIKDGSGTVVVNGEKINMIQGRIDKCIEKGLIKIVEGGINVWIGDYDPVWGILTYELNLD